MKKDDLKKLYSGGKKDSKLAKFWGKFFFLFFVTVSLSVSQINVNGFYLFNSYKTFPNYTNIFQTDFNHDSYPDIVIYNRKINNVVTHSANKNGTYNLGIKKFFFFPITAINFFNKNIHNEDLYIFVSRKERLAGLASFTKYGSLKLLNINRFSTYPSKVIVADLNNDGNSEALIFGNTFAGITIIKENNFILQDVTVTREGTYSDASFINLDYDNYTDFAAINMLNNSIDFFYNNGNNEFVNERQIKYQKQINNLKTFRFNGDKFDDLIFTFQNSFHILLGDSVSSFNRQLDVKVQDDVSSFEMGDFNSDKINDIVFITNKNNEIKVMFGKNDSTFFDPVLLYHGSNLTDINYSVDFDNKRLLALSADGQLINFSTYHALPDSFKLAYSGLTKEMNVETDSKNKYYKISFIDEYDQKFKILSGDNNSIHKLNQFPIFESFSEFESSGTNYGADNTILFNKGDQLIEILNTDADSSMLKQIYTSEPILDAKHLYNQKLNQSSIAALTYGDSTLSVSKYDLRASYLEGIRSDSLDINVLTALIHSGKGPGVYYWKQKVDTLILFYRKWGAENSDEIYSTVSHLDSTGRITARVTLCEDNSTDNSKPISIVQQGSLFEIIIIKNEALEIIKLAKENLGNNISSINDIKYFEDTKLKQQGFFVLANDSTSIFRMEIDKKYKLQSFSKYIETAKIYDYFLTKLFDGHNYIFYTAKNENCIKFLRIK